MRLEGWRRWLGARGCQRVGGRLEKEHGGGCWKLLEVGEGRKLEEDETHWTREDVGGWLRLESGGGRRRLEEEGGGGWRMAEDRGWCLEETGGGWRRLEEFGFWRRLDVGGGWRRWRLEEEERSRDTHCFCPEVGARHAAP